MKIFTDLFSRRPKREPGKRLVYVIPDDHSEQWRTSRFAFFSDPSKRPKAYCEYARKVKKILQRNGIQPSDCYIYLDSAPVDVLQRVLQMAILEQAKELPNDLTNTLITALMREGAVVMGCEDRAFLNDPVIRPDTPEGGQRRDKFIAQHVLDTLPEDKVGIIVLGAGHSIEEVLDRNAFEVRTTRDLYLGYLKEGNPLAYRAEVIEERQRRGKER